MENKTRKIQKREQYSRKGRVNKEQVSPGLFFFFFIEGIVEKSALALLVLDYLFVKKSISSFLCVLRERSCFLWNNF
jgi:hypothetical protein